MSPLRPWEWARLSGDDAEWWLEALTIRNAFNEGVAAARGDKAALDQFERQHVGQVG